MYRYINVCVHIDRHICLHDHYKLNIWHCYSPKRTGKNSKLNEKAINKQEQNIIILSTLPILKGSESPGEFFCGFEILLFKKTLLGTFAPTLPVGPTQEVQSTEQSRHISGLPRYTGVLPSKGQGVKGICFCSGSSIVLMDSETWGPFMILQESGVTHRQLLSGSFFCSHSYYAANKYTSSSYTAWKTGF